MLAGVVDERENGPNVPLPLRLSENGSGRASMLSMANRCLVRVRVCVISNFIGVVKSYLITIL